MSPHRRTHSPLDRSIQWAVTGFEFFYCFRFCFLRRSIRLANFKITIIKLTIRTKPRNFASSPRKEYGEKSIFIIKII